MKKSITLKQMIVLFAVGIGAGAMFILPYLKDTYYVSLMNGLGITDTEMGGLLSMYALAFLVIGIPCGYLADRFSTKSMLVLILAMTAAGGFWYATLPNYAACLVIFSIWSFTTTMYWPIMNKVSAAMGENRVKSYGYMESFRAAAYTVMSFCSIFVFTWFGEGKTGIQSVIALYSILLVIMTVITLVFFKTDEGKNTTYPTLAESFKQAFFFVKTPSIWLLGGIVFCTLCAYTCTGMIVPYLEKIMNVSPQFAAAFGTIRMAILPTIAGITSGIFSGKLGSVSKLMFIGYTVVGVAGVGLIMIPSVPSMLYPFIAIALIGIFAVVTNKTMYMAPLSELDIPTHQIGMASSLVSMIGFSCELFIYTLVGNMVETNLGATGYNYVFMLMIAFVVLGVIFTIALRRYTVKPAKQA